MPRPVVALAARPGRHLGGCADAPAPRPADLPLHRPRRAAPPPQRRPKRRAAPAPPRGRRGRAPRVVFLGDSLTAGLGLPLEQAYPSLIGARLAARGTGWTVVNAGVSGDTSAGGLRRLEWSLDGGAAIVVVALGGNDALRGLPPADLERNLDAIVTKAKASGRARGARRAWKRRRTTGPEYTARFRQVYTRRRHGATTCRCCRSCSTASPAWQPLNQADGIHPNQAGAARVADTVWRVLDPIVRALEDSTTE